MRFMMRLFNPDNRTRSAEHKRVYALYELAYTLNDFGAALLFPESVTSLANIPVKPTSAPTRGDNWVRF